jgi:hypothetical protein
MKKIAPIVAAFLFAASCLVAAPAAHADTFPTFPVTVADPFAHGVETIQQPDSMGNWVDVRFTLCSSRPLRLIAPVTPEAALTAYNYRLAAGGVLIPTTSASAEFRILPRLGGFSGSYSFTYYADAARGPVLD